MVYTVSFRIARASYVVIACHDNKFLKLIHPEIVNAFENMLLSRGLVLGSGMRTNP